MRVVACDLETVPFSDVDAAPPIVCMGTYDGRKARIITSYKRRVVRKLRRLLSDPDVYTLWHNGPYDFGCMLRYPELHGPLKAALNAGRVFDTHQLVRVREIEGRKNRGDLSLETLCGFQKQEGLQTSFGPLLGKPLTAYSKAQRRYVEADVVNCWELFDETVGSDRGVLRDGMAAVARRGVWLQAVRNRGLVTDRDAAKQLHKVMTANVAGLQEIAEGEGIVRTKALPTERANEIAAQLRVNADSLGFRGTEGAVNKRVLQAHVRRVYGRRAPMTKAARNRKSTKPFVPQIRTDGTTLAESGDPLLELFSEFTSWRKALSTDIPIYLREHPVRTRWSLLDTLRTGSSQPNVMNVSKKPGFRECFVPRPGYNFVACDFRMLELVSLAQCCKFEFGGTHMIDLIKSGVDLHAFIGAAILKIPYEKFDKVLHYWERQCGKCVNFGGPGMLSAETLVVYAKCNYGVVMTLRQAQQLLETWRRKMPDAYRHVQYTKNNLRRNSRGWYLVPVYGTDIVRATPSLTAAANTPFQLVGALAASNAGWRVFEKHLDPGNVLSVAPMVNFCHDDLLLEVPEGLEHEVADELASTMIQGCAEVIRDVPIEVEFAAMKRWTKSAQAVYNRKGKLIPWEPGLDCYTLDGRPITTKAA